MIIKRPHSHILNALLKRYTPPCGLLVVLIQRKPEETTMHTMHMDAAMSL